VPEDLVPGDVEQYTRGRLSQTDPETVRALDAALARVRRYCGWHVSPVRTETIRVDRPPSTHPILVLPTLNIVTLNSITIDSIPVDLANVKVSVEAPGVLSMKNWEPWGGARWDSGFGLVEITLKHGYTAAEAPDFRDAVLSLVDRATLTVNSGGAGPLIEKEVDDVRYRWGTGSVDSAVGAAPLDSSIISKYKLY
jgi:hypothetical protein